MARGKKKASESAPHAIMIPSLHGDVSNDVNDILNPCPWFNESGGDADADETYSTNVMGSFRCATTKCEQTGWGSRKVSIVIRRYPGGGYNAVIFSQRCKACRKLGFLTVDKTSYVERVAYRLKKWAGIPMPKPEHSEHRGPEHESDLCEGCQRGYCKRSAISGWV
ncbi:zinc-binding domain-containing protein [Podospora didyma]|uniref:Zinc-binding domain-containing protein n=1 Tax=Podospora didyma TaxID=330526 RepID=A0AAE0NQ92_9PEZI|nr:zinc-binding domain-containing protein [Podospora didyma]